ncbi:MAG: MFS transporter, partial [Sciscionella sp.]
VAGFSPLAAGTAMLPVTGLMLLLSARAGALAQRIGPRLPMTVGPLVCMTGLLLMLRVGPDASYLRDVLPAVLVFGLGLSSTVAPLTATVLDAADQRHPGVASGVNNAVARAAGQLAVAVVPVVAGLAGRDYENPGAFDAGFDNAMLIAAAMLALGSLVSFALVRGGLGAPGLTPRLRLEECVHCGVASPQSYPSDWADDRPAAAGSPVAGEQ